MKRILIIDDSPFIAREITDIIEGKDYEVAGHAKNGEDGISMYKELKPDLVTLDIIMPGIDGIETAQKLLEFDPKARIVMLSSLCDFDTLREVHEMNLDFLVAKPIDKEKLLEAFEQLLSK
ncbi:MAG: response regulator [Lachnospiraceae bacterium]|nr:response regulator [Lachnospiraceae bacterium]